MNKKIHFTRPESFYYGDNYLLREPNFNGERRSISTVTFVSYTACPAIVIIKFGDGSKHRCLRDDLFELRGNLLNRIAGADILSKLQHHANIAKTRLVVIFNNLKTIFSYQDNFI